jgi:hypothetical protein
MKRLIVAVAIALSTPSFAAVGSPFEQNELDRALPSLPESITAYEPVASERMPFEQTQLDRGALGESERVQLAQIGNTSYTSAEDSESAGVNDNNFIAPPQ